ncbi:MAG: cation:proton antiporter, partial [Candidatus Bathyarchaeia archaeon]
ERKEIAHAIQPVMLFLAPLFFVMLGMQVNLLEMVPTVALTIVLILVATGGKIIGCYIPARFVGRLSHTSGMIVGVGMVPRGEVGLIIAGAGLLAGAVSRDLFGAAVAVSIVTTLITPGLLRGIFRREDREKPRTPSS